MRSDTFTTVASSSPPSSSPPIIPASSPPFTHPHRRRRRQRQRLAIYANKLPFQFHNLKSIGVITLTVTLLAVHSSFHHHTTATATGGGGGGMHSTRATFGSRIHTAYTPSSMMGMRRQLSRSSSLSLSPWVSPSSSSSSSLLLPTTTSKRSIGMISATAMRSRISNTPSFMTRDDNTIGRRSVYPLRDCTSSLRLLATSSPNDNDNDDNGTKKKKRGKPKPSISTFKPSRRKQKIEINPNDDEFDVDALTAAFDEMARKEGFDPDSAYFAHDGDEDDDDDTFMDVDDDNLFNEDDEEPLDFGNTDPQHPNETLDQQMERRLREATLFDSSPLNPPSLHSSHPPESYGLPVDDGTPATPKPRQPTATIPQDARTCGACGTSFQSKDVLQPGYLPKEKYDLQMKVGRLEDALALQRRADGVLEEEGGDWSPEDEVEYLLRAADGEKSSGSMMGGIDIEGLLEELGLDHSYLPSHLSPSDQPPPRPKTPICQRCHHLQNSTPLPPSLRPSPTTTTPLLTQSHFRSLLLPLSLKPCVIIALIDIFDFAGSVLPELNAIAGPENPVFIAANKIDLLPKTMGTVRVENWVRRELEYYGVGCLAKGGRGAVRLVSCRSGEGVGGLVGSAREVAGEMGEEGGKGVDVYVVGAANAGKSTLVNFLLGRGGGGGGEGGGGGSGGKGKKMRRGNRNRRKDVVTTSPLPGTTLKFIKVEFDDDEEEGGGKGKRKKKKEEFGGCLYDTPGLLIPGTITELLTPKELKMVVPKRPIEPVTFRIASGKTVLIGGLASIEITGAQTKPFLLTFYVSNDIKLHPTDAARSDAFREKHCGTRMLSPPVDDDDNNNNNDDDTTTRRVEQLPPFEYHNLTIQGRGWKEAGADVAIRGLGWIAVTGAGTATLRVGVPGGIGVSVRPPLMPFDVWESTAKYTGGKATRKAGRTRFGKRKRRGVGRR